jgi:nucleoside-diphosphate-sugar epimerase
VASATGQGRRVLIAGGTGFIGFHACREFVARGWDVTALGLEPGPRPGVFPDAVRIVLCDLDAAEDRFLLDLLRGCDAAVFCAGADDRVLPSRPAFAFFRRRNVESAARFFWLCREAGVKRGVLVGSYFAHFARAWPELELGRHHPYIRSRVEQEEAALAAAGSELALVALELPWVFGTMPGARPLWCPLVSYVRHVPVLLFTRGGTNAVAAGQVARAIRDAAEQGEAGAARPVAGANLSWAELLGRIAELIGRRRRVVVLPGWLVRAGAGVLRLAHRIRGRESGLDPVRFVGFQYRESFLEPAGPGFSRDELDRAIADTVRACERR